MISNRTYRCLPQQEFEKDAYRIRPVSDSDIEAIRQWRNAQMDVLRQSEEISPQAQKEYFSRVIWPDMDRPKPSNILVSLFLGGKHIGYGALVHIAWEHRRAEISFLLEPKRTQNADSYAQDFSAFLGLIQELAFDGLNLNRIYTETYASRDMHIKVIESAGFRREGVLKEHVMIGGKAVDSIMHGYLRSYGSE